MSDTIVPEKLDSYEAHLGTAQRIGPLRVHMPRGPVVAVDAPGYTTRLMRYGGDAEGDRIIIMLYEPGVDGNDGTGMVAQMTATQARSIATSLLRLATHLDTERPN